MRYENVRVPRRARRAQPAGGTRQDDLQAVNNSAALGTGALAVWLLLVAGCRPPAPEAHTHISFLISCDTDGWIVPCGCSAKQSGGLPRRATLVNNLLQNEAVVVLDVGGAPAGVSDYHELKFEAILQGELAMGLSAHNIGASEAALGAETLRSISQKCSVPLVSANTCDASGDPIAPSYRIINVSGKRFAIIGVLDPEYATPEVAVTEPYQRILDVLDEISDPVDGTIVLAYLNRGNLSQLASQIPEVDLILGGPTGQPIRPRKSGATWLASITNKGKFVAHFRFDPSAQDHWQGEIVEVDDTLADEPQQQRNLKKFYDQLAERDFPATETRLARQISSRRLSGMRYAGTEQCRRCHVADCSHWIGTKHAHAWETLVNRNSHVDPYCQQCHTTGYGQEGGFISLARSTSMVNVGCESCHGPAANHAQNPVRRSGAHAADSCLGCHDPENSPAFDYAPYWRTIIHGVKITSADQPLQQAENPAVIGDRK